MFQLILLVLACYVIHRWIAAKFDFFEKLNVPFVKPLPLFGSLWPYMKWQKSLAEVTLKGYRLFPGSRFSGFFMFREPIFLIHDPELIKHICIRDFDHFTDHINKISLEVDPYLGRTLFFSDGQRWKNGRTALSPAFTGSKMRNMFELLTNYNDRAMKRLVKDAAGNALETEMKDLFQRFGIDMMASVFLGVESDSVHNPNNEFYQYGKRMEITAGVQGFRMFILGCLPKSLAKILGLRIIPKDIENFYNDVVCQVIKKRLELNSFRPDLIHVLLQARKHGMSVDKSDEKLDNAGFATVQEYLQASSSNLFKWTDCDIAATASLLFIGGLESSTALICFALYELALNPKIQQKLRTEVDSTQKALENSKLTYEAMQQMVYLDMVVTETLRKWPSFGIANRCCTKPYILENFDGNRIMINKNQGLFFPIYEIHRDPKYYPDPERFDPERFSPANRNNLNQDAYLPFGVGPRNCIGSRLALMLSKCYLFHLIAHFEIHLSKRTDVPIQLDVRSVVLKAKNGFWFNLIPRDK